MKRAPWLLLGAALSLTCVARAQVSVRVGTLPPDGTETHRVFQVVTRVGSAATEYAYLGGMRIVALRSERGEPVLHLAFDSLRARVRAGDAPWRERSAAGLDTLWTQLVIGDASAPIRRLGPEGPESALLDDLLPCGPGLWLAPRDVRSGDRWPVDLSVPVASGVTPPTGGVRGLGASGMVTVDSVIPRERDTLAFMTLDATVRPAPVRESDGTRLSPSGTVRGRIVWSTGWRQCVSMAHRTEIRVTIANGSPDVRSVVVSTTVRQVVVPSR